MELSPIMDVTSKRWLINAPHLNIYIFVEAMLRQQAATYVGIRSLLKFADNSKIHTWKIRWFICYYCLLFLAYALFALSCQHMCVVLFASSRMMMMMKLPMLPCAEKLELVLSTAPKHEITMQLAASVLRFIVILMCDPIVSCSNVPSVHHGSA